MRAERLLAIAAWLCGAHARATTFEPLVADWQREWLAARDPIALLGLGLIGAAIGRRRALKHQPIGMRTIVVSWIGGWLAASLLGCVAGYQGMYREPVDPAATPWLPPIVTLGVGLAAWFALNHQNPEPTPPASACPP